MISLLPIPKHVVVEMRFVAIMIAFSDVLCAMFSSKKWSAWMPNGSFTRHTLVYPQGGEVATTRTYARTSAAAKVAQHFHLLFIGGESCLAACTNIVLFSVQRQS